jgi:hypothetical protein
MLPAGWWKLAGRGQGLQHERIAFFYFFDSTRPLSDKEILSTLLRPPFVLFKLLFFFFKYISLAKSPSKKNLSDSTRSD